MGELAWPVTVHVVVDMFFMVQTSKARKEKKQYRQVVGTRNRVGTETAHTPEEELGVPEGTVVENWYVVGLKVSAQRQKVGDPNAALELHCLIRRYLHVCRYRRYLHSGNSFIPIFIPMLIGIVGIPMFIGV